MKPPPGETPSGDPTDEVVVRYASWPRRVAASVVDLLPIVALVVVALVLLWLTRNRVCDGDPSVGDFGSQCGHSGASPLGRSCLLASWLAVIGYAVWNFGLRQGATGASIGKSALKIRVVDIVARSPIGFWRSVLRQLVHALDAMSLGVGYLWPLWDRRHQTFADKLMSTVCVNGTR